MAQDLTKGSPFKQILWFAVPFLIGNLFQQFYNIADMLIVRMTISPDAYTAVGATSSLVWFASGAVQYLATGFAVITAQRVGAKDEEGIKKSFASGLMLSLAISALLSVLCVIFARPMLELLDTSPTFIDRSYRYIVWIFAGLVATSLYNFLSQTIRALGDSRTPLYFLVLACVVNIILDYVFIAVFGMDTDGAGLATVLAQLISAGCCALYIKKKQPCLHVAKKHFSVDFSLWRELLHVGVPMAFLNMVLSMGSVVMQFVTNNIGDVFTSAQVTGSKIETFVTQPLLSVGSAASVFTAQNYGAKKYDRVLAGARKSTLLGFLWCVIATLIMIPFGKVFVTLLGGDVEPIIIDNAYRYILTNTALILIVMPLIVQKSVLQAVGRTFWTMMSGFTEVLGRAGLSITVITLMNAAVVTDQIGFNIMCFANPAAWLCGLLTVLLDYLVLMRKFKRLAKEQKVAR